MLEVTPVRAFKDNYLWVAHQKGQAGACVVDPGDAEPVLRYLAESGLELEAILVTHHHSDHIGGIDDLLHHHKVPVFGPASQKIPQVTHPVHDGAVLEFLGHSFSVVAVPGHTLEHIAYVVTGSDQAVQLFCGDTLFAAGCGRMFEGTPAMMHASLQKLASLPPHTLVYCAHEYTLGNLRFASAVMPRNPAVAARIAAEGEKRARGVPTLPSLLAVELETNPFLRCAQPDIAALARTRVPGTTGAAAVFGVLRLWKDTF